VAREYSLCKHLASAIFALSKSIGSVSFRERGGGKLKKQRAFVGAAIAAAVSGVAFPAFAVDNVWTGATDTNWNTPTNWSLGRVPTNANGAPTGDTFDDAVVNSTTVVPLISADLAATPRDIVVGSGAGTNGQVNHTAGTAATGNGNWMFVGRDGGTGKYNLGNTATTGGTLTGIGLGSGSINVSGRIYVAGHFGGAANGVLNINTTGTITTGSDINLGAANGTGTVNLDAGTVNVGGWISVGRDENGTNGTGNWNQSGGTVNVNGNTVLGLPGTHGNFNLTGGNGTVAVSGNGTLSSNADIIVAENNPTAVAVVNQSGGRVLVGGNLDVQRNGTGTYNLSGGTLSVDGRTPDDPASQVLGIDGRQGTFTFTGGRITRSNAGVITYVGDLHVGNKAAGFKLDTDKTFAVAGLLDVAPGVTFDVTGRTIPAHTGGGFETGSFPLGTDNSILGTFDPSTTSVLGLNNLAGATFISEAAGEGHTYSDTQRVFWVQESAGQVSLQYSVAAAPEPGTIALLALSGVTLLTRRRRK
jgi:hypothetical protein